MEANQAQKLSDARTKQLKKQVETARKQPLIEKGNVKYTETVSPSY